MKSPIKFITFGRFGSEENWKKEREQFLQYKKELINMLSGFEIKEKSLEGIEETKINEMIKIYIKECKSILLIPLGIFMRFMGLSYIALSNEERNEIEEMDFTYENWEKKSSNIIENYLQRSKNACPSIIRFCFEDICFVFHAQIVYGCEFTLKNFVTFIRDYFILDKTKEFLKKYRDAKIYENIKKIVINLYPSLKQNYGINRYFEKILSYILNDTDYNYEKTKIILDNFYNKRINNNIKDDETIKFKDN